MNDKIIINGIEYTILVKFTSKATEKDYIIFSTLEPVDNEIELLHGILKDGQVYEVDTPEEQEIIAKMTSTITTIPEAPNKRKK